MLGGPLERSGFPPPAGSFTPPRCGLFLLRRSQMGLTPIGIPKETMSVHGFRAMARTCLDEQLHFPPHLVEHQLAHRVKDALGTAYNRTQHPKERRDMMQRWADYLNRLRTETTA